MSKDGYHQFCPVAKACELLEPRWTMLLLCEMWSGSTRFNEIQRGVPGISPTLLSKRLREMEERGLVERRESLNGSEVHYRTTTMANELEPIVHALGEWAHRNVDTEVTLEHLDARLLMWNIRRKVDAGFLPPDRRSVIQFTFPDLPREDQSFWLVAKPGEIVDLCSIDPRYNVDLFIRADLYAMTAAWMGHSTYHAEIARERIALIGDRTLAATIDRWLVRSSYAAVCPSNSRKSA
ncbi:transcriptional regulator, HxlR family [Rhizobium sp. PDO1-076]|uniref:winged helix-turn-helix transcriptional regulator n=1 Tax=Rhizobium sp. PDO1-076 TaxID=1125979 RepID=UPI00024E39F2|nr:helix-turn-helix domain-containing protein [Rhizobium sp. PDO1-076]EHS48897.1 transcriptional regulator, HxlR family [Rhizobium sp. PDO1-076]